VSEVKIPSDTTTEAIAAGDITSLLFEPEIDTALPTVVEELPVAMITNGDKEQGRKDFAHPNRWSP
jgi:hypothetical protein